LVKAMGGFAHGLEPNLRQDLCAGQGRTDRGRWGKQISNRPSFLVSPVAIHDHRHLS
jgi:hypothetical protein